MSTATVTPSFDGFDEYLEFAAITEGLDFTQPMGEPSPEPETPRAPRQRRSRGTEERAAIAESLGIRRRRSRERGW